MSEESNFFTWLGQKFNIYFWQFKELSNAEKDNLVNLYREDHKVKPGYEREKYMKDFYIWLDENYAISVSLYWRLPSESRQKLVDAYHRQKERE